MAIKILVNGATGKMGQVTTKAIQNDSELELIGQMGRNDDLAANLRRIKPDIVIDFTVPAVVYQNARLILEAGVRPIIGTTGLDRAQIADLAERCEQQKLGAIIAPNFSIGAVLMMQFAKQAAPFFPDVEIIEFHHPAKIDAPSGTALKTAEMIAENRKPTKPPTADISGSRGMLANGVPIHAVRLTGVVANQDVLFGGIGETLTLRHNTISREAFMPGVLLACKKIMNLQQLVYGLENIL